MGWEPDKPTADCELYPPYLQIRRPDLPLPRMEDTEVDAFLHVMLNQERQRYGATSLEVPRTQWGRRQAVASFLEFQRGLARKERQT